MVIAQNAWRRLGVKVEILGLEWAVFIRERVNKRDFDAVVLGWAMGLDADIYQIFHSSQTGPQQLNFVGYAEPGGRHAHGRASGASTTRPARRRWPGSSTG